MTREDLQAQHPDLCAALLAEGAAAVTLPDVAAAEVAAVTAERARVTALLDCQADPALTRAAVDAGTEPGAFALEVLAAERAGRTRALDDVAGGLAAPVAPAPAAEPAQVVDFMTAARARAAADGIPLAKALRAVRNEQPDLAEAHSSACLAAVARKV